MQRPVVTLPRRRLSYRFMAAEAFWIMTGDDRVSTIAPFNPNISAFSDNGETFFGAYGPKVVAQLPYILSKLRSDPDTRQAGLTIWRESPQPSKDIPCTVAIWFQVRRGFIETHVFMRSSDAWLGVPYDIFNFSMLTHLVCAELNQGIPNLRPGTLYLTAASSHLYEKNWDDAKACINDLVGYKPQPVTPDTLWLSPINCINWLKALRHIEPDNTLRWWNQ